MLVFEGKWCYDCSSSSWFTARNDLFVQRMGPEGGPYHCTHLQLPLSRNSTPLGQGSPVLPLVFPTECWKQVLGLGVPTAAMFLQLKLGLDVCSCHLLWFVILCWQKWGKVMCAAALKWLAGEIGKKEKAPLFMYSWTTQTDVLSKRSCIKPYFKGKGQAVLKSHFSQTLWVSAIASTNTSVGEQ